MARKSREKSEINQYLVNISLDEGIVIYSDDRKVFFNTAMKYFNSENIKLFAYSFNENSFRFVLEDENNLNKVVKQICVSFSIYYNNKYSHTGKVFFDRFKSIASKSIMDTYNFMASFHFLDYVEKYNSLLNYTKNKFISYSCILKQFVNKYFFKTFLKSLYYTDDVQNVIIKVIGQKKLKNVMMQIQQEKEEKIIRKVERKKVGIISNLMKLKNYGKYTIEESNVSTRYNSYLIKRNKQFAQKRKEKIKKII